jgi:hypothetical protein
MALDILFPDGDHQDFIVEIPNGTLNAPIDILSKSNTRDFIVEIPDGTLNAPIDILTINGDLPVSELVLTAGGGGETSTVYVT